MMLYNVHCLYYEAKNYVFLIRFIYSFYSFAMYFEYMVAYQRKYFM